MVEAVDAEFPGLFCHRTRQDWGVSVLSGVRDGKRRYLFEGGEERTMAAEHHHLMQRVQRPDRSQHATCARLMALLAKRADSGALVIPPATKALLEQLEKFRAEYPAGFSGDAWQGDEQSVIARRAREVAAQAPALVKLTKSKRLEGVWSQVVALVRESGLISDELPNTTSSEQQTTLGEAVRDLLHGPELYDRRFDRFLMRYESVFHQAPSWQAGTALAALISPIHHVWVEPNAFRKQLKVLSRQSALAARPSGSNYVRCQDMARALAGTLAAQGEVPLDLLEVHAFIRATL